MSLSLLGPGLSGAESGRKVGRGLIKGNVLCSSHVALCEGNGWIIGPKTDKVKIKKGACQTYGDFKHQFKPIRQSTGFLHLLPPPPGMISAKLNTTLNRLREQCVTVHQGNEPVEDVARGGSGGVCVCVCKGACFPHGTKRQSRPIRAEQAPRTFLITPPKNK